MTPVSISVFGLFVLYFGLGSLVLTGVVILFHQKLSSRRNSAGTSSHPKVGMDMSTLGFPGWTCMFCRHTPNRKLGHAYNKPCGRQCGRERVAYIVRNACTLLVQFCNKTQSAPLPHPCHISDVCTKNTQWKLLKRVQRVLEMIQPRYHEVWMHSITWGGF